METKFSPKKFICLKPFQEISIDLDGEVKICCDNWLKSNRPSLPSLNDTSTSENVWNHPTYQAFRQSILESNYQYCSNHCPFIKMNRADGPFINRRKALQSYRDVLQTQLCSPKVLHFNFDRSCNLKCPSCRSHFVSDDQNRVKKILSILRNNFPLVEEIILTGRGDPFASLTYRQWLQNLTDEDFPKLKKIHLHTNGILWNEEMWKSLSPRAQKIIKSADISIDAAIPQTYMTNRGSSFEQLCKNITFIKQNTSIHLSLLFVVQQNNFKEMIPFVCMAKELGADRILFTKLDNWGTYNPEDYLSRAVFLPKHPQYFNYRVELSKLKVIRWFSLAFSSLRINLGNL